MFKYIYLMFKLCIYILVCLRIYSLVWVLYNLLNFPLYTVIYWTDLHKDLKLFKVLSLSFYTFFSPDSAWPVRTLEGVIGNLSEDIRHDWFGLFYGR